MRGKKTQKGEGLMTGRGASKINSFIKNRGGKKSLVKRRNTKNEENSVGKREPPHDFSRSANILVSGPCLLRKRRSGRYEGGNDHHKLVRHVASNGGR